MVLNYLSFVKLQEINQWNKFSYQSLDSFYKIHEIIARSNNRDLTINQTKIQTLIQKASNRFDILLNGNNQLRISSLNSAEINEVLNQTKNYWVEIKKDISFLLDGKEQSEEKILSEMDNLLIAINLESEITSEIGEKIIKSFIFYQILYSLALIGILISIIIYFNKLTKRTYKILNYLKRINSGNLNENFKEEDSNFDEISELAENLNYMVSRLNQSMVSGSYFETVLNSIKNYIVEIDHEGTILKSNKSFDSFIHREEQSHRNNIFEYFNIEKMPIRELQEKKFKKGELKIKSKEQEIPITLFISKLKDLEKDNFIFSFYDISEEISMESKLYQSAKLISLGEMAANIAHEVNNPMTIINSLAHKIKKMDIDKKYESEVSKMTESVDRVTDLLKELKSFTRKDSELQDPTIDFLVDEEILKAIKLIEDTYHEKYKVNFKTQLHCKNLLTNGYPNRFQQVLLNFFSNAKDAFEENGGDITVSTTRIISNIILEIKDTGKGIPKELQKKIFETFFTTKIAGEGTGLGMSISTRIIHEMNGKIEVDSEEGRGTVFKITIPIAHSEQVLLVDKEDSKPSYKERLINKKYKTRALVVDDDDIVREIVVFLLEDYFHFEIIEAHDGEEALEYLKNESFDFLFTDIEMPNLNGIDLLKKLPKNLKDKLFITVITGGIKNPNHKQEVKQLCDHILLKPINETHLEELLEVIQRKKVA